MQDPDSRKIEEVPEATIVEKNRQGLVPLEKGEIELPEGIGHISGTASVNAKETPPLTLIERIGLADFSESSKIGALSGLGYLTTYGFHTGYFNRFEAPRTFVLVELTTVFQTVVFLAIVIPFLWLGLEMVIGIGSGMVGRLPVVVQKDWLWVILSTISLVATGVLAGFVSPLFLLLYASCVPLILLTIVLTFYNRKRSAERTLNTSASPLKTDVGKIPYSITTLVFHTFGKQRLISFAFVCAFSLACCGTAFLLGMLAAQLKQTFPVVDTGEVVIMAYDSRVVVATHDAERQTIGPPFRVLAIPSDTLVFRHQKFILRWNKESAFADHPLGY